MNIVPVPSDLLSDGRNRIFSGFDTPDADQPAIRGVEWTQKSQYLFSRFEKGKKCLQLFGL
jgi:hypothetical protein